jgi:drug/metabolite transporter (DMT)-like permease
MSRARARARLELFGAAVLFGLMAAITRLASLGHQGLDPAQMTLARFAVGGGMTLALFRLRPGTFRPVHPRLLVARGILGGLAALTYFASLTRIPAGEATLLNNTFPVFAVLLSFFTLGERPTVHLLLALALTTLGVFLVLRGEAAGLEYGVGHAVGLLSAVLGAGAVTAIRRLRASTNAPTIFFAFCLGGLLVSLPFALRDWPDDPRVWAMALAVGVLSFGAQMLMTDAYGALTVAEAGLWQQLTPLASFVWAVPLLGEPITAATVAGVLVGAAGVTYGTVLGHKPAGARRAPPAKETTPVAEPVEPS